MPKNKKKFIDKKNAITFHLVHRSQQDPLTADENAPQHVLLPALGSTERSKTLKEDRSKRKEEQLKYGIYFDDDYDYLQHLRDPNVVAVWEQSESLNQEQTSKLKLPSSVFASEIEEDVGLLNKAAPESGIKHLFYTLFRFDFEYLLIYKSPRKN
uniref:Protein LTV1 homolog n=1 Tax=Clastoptera arizonana TaxID=38151 RepID=A0A1B6EFD0_9HEMI